MTKTKISNFHTSFFITEMQKLAFHIPHVKYWVQIIVVTYVELCLNSANHFKMCYVAMIMLRG